MNGPSTVYSLLSRSDRVRGIEGKLILPRRGRGGGDMKPSGSGHLRIIAHPRGARESRLGIRSPVGFLDRRPHPAAFIESNRDSRPPIESGGRPIWFTELVTADYWIHINLCASTNQARNRIVSLFRIPRAFLSFRPRREPRSCALITVSITDTFRSPEPQLRERRANRVSDLLTRLLNVALRWLSAR